LGSPNHRENDRPPDAPVEGLPSVSVRFWGTRGSIPSPGPDTVRYGGNTSCIEVQAGSSRIILDAGTGIHLLGHSLAKEAREKTAAIFLTHFHWDHVQGLPFFAPAHDPDFTIQVFGPRQGSSGVEELISDQMGPVHFPLALDEFPAAFTISEVEEGTWNHQEFRMQAMRMRHPSVTFGYRCEAFGRSVVYIPDNEIEGGPLPSVSEWRRALLKFVGGADLLIHDAMFTDEERPLFQGWGHSTFGQVVDLAVDSNVEKAVFFHHAPLQSDANIDGLLRRYRAAVESQGHQVQLSAAVEGSTIRL